MTVSTSVKPKKGLIASNECAFCHQRGHWKYHCPKKRRLSASSFQQPQNQFWTPPAAYTAFAPIPDPDLASLTAQISQLQHILSTSQPSPFASVVSSLHLGLLGSSSGISSSVWI
ncbi:hypothetical protein HYC85_029979 [Camellia sinensis]|uniref:CCHC-type domain-containing protein n=1 Tax=Camellia sinensis TaxID=4442 RepID=A0A7J7G243_CAMSI|nr:hypothetical protein HYC85_029979 [Camellia sinensis]